MAINKKILFKTIRGFGRRSGLLVCALFVRTFSAAVKPFVFLHYSAVIVNGLYEKAAQPYILARVFWLTAITLAIEAGEYLAGWYVESAVRRMSYDQSLELLRQAVKMNYQQLESAQIQSMIENVKQCKFQRGDMFEKELQFIENCLKGVFGILASLFFLFQFAKEKIDSGVNAGQFGIAFLCFIILVFVAATVSIQNGNKHNEKIFKRFTEVAPINRLYGFYRMNIFQNYKYGKEIRIFNEEELIEGEFKKVLGNVGSFMQNIGKEEGKFRSINSLLNGVLNGIAYIYIGINAYHHVIGAGSIIKYAGAVTQLFAGITQTVCGLADLKGNEKFLQQYYELLETAIPTDDETEIPAVHSVEIEFENVSFKYPNANTWALKNVSFHISDHEHMAMVGQNGSGKTTCIRLLLRLYKPDSGRILLNGMDIQNYRDREYWKLISVVFQDFKIFSFNIRQNIEGNMKKDNAKLMEAIQNAGMGEAVERMYAGVESCLYKDYDGSGIMISGGEAQKLAIAKALYKDAPVFVMDEPSAALDPVSEAELYEKTNMLLKDKTMIFISHRLSSCCFYNRIVVLKEGEIVENGSHEELLGQNGEYRKLWDAQAVHYR